MWDLDYKESWVPKNWCFWGVGLEKTLESPRDYKEIQPVHPKGDQSWVFIGRTDVEYETPILWPLYEKSWLMWKDSDVGKDWGQERKGTTEAEMVRWNHRLNGHEFGWTPGIGDGEGCLACCGSWGSQTVGHSWAAELKWTDLKLWNIIAELSWPSICSEHSHLPTIGQNQELCNILSNLLNAVLKVKSRIVVNNTFILLSSWMGAVGHCHCPPSGGSIRLIHKDV